jgi:hypothetical protein
MSEPRSPSKFLRSAAKHNLVERAPIKFPSFVSNTGQRYFA